MSSLTVRITYFYGIIKFIDFEIYLSVKSLFKNAWIYRVEIQNIYIFTAQDFLKKKRIYIYLKKDIVVYI